MAKLYDQLKDYINWAFGITVSVSFFLLAKDELTHLYRNEVVTGVLATMLLVATVARFFLYVHAVRTELDLLASVFDDSKIRSFSGSILPVVILLSVLMGAMIAFSVNILVYTSLAVFFSVMDMQGQAAVNRNIGALIFAKAHLERESSGYRQAVFAYYFENPLILRASTILVLFCGSLILAIFEHFTGNSVYRYSAYAIAITTTIGGEVVIGRWRRHRDDNLMNIE